MRTIERNVSARSQLPYASLALALLTWGLLTVPAWAATDISRSTNIALSQDGSQLFNVNFEANNVTVFRVDGGTIRANEVQELAVDREPACVAVRDAKAYVTNGATGTVTVLDKFGETFKVIKEIIVGTEPRGCALNGTGDRLVVANHSAGTVSIINTSSDTVIDTVDVGGNPMAVAVKGDRVFVTQFFARLRDGGREGFNDGKEGVVQTFTLSDPDNITEITLSPLADSGFTADRSRFCNATSDPDPVNETFCPDRTGANIQLIQNTPQGVYPNQLGSALICGDKLYLPNIGAQPEPPVQFTTNVQALVHVVDINTLSERTDLHVNLNAQIATEPDPANPADLVKLFGNDLVAIDADAACQNFFIVSRGGNNVLKATLVNGKLDIGAPNNVVRLRTGNIPTGIVVHNDKAFVNNEVDTSVSVLSLGAGGGTAGIVQASPEPDPGSFADSVRKGKLTFFTALGVSNNGLVGVPIRSIDPLQFRGKQSNNAWSTCASCHPSGLSDGVTWIFPDGPRQTLPLDALYSKINGAHDTRINNWSAARDSVTDFNGNSIAVQGGTGFVDDPTRVFDHGLSSGASEALDVETTWAQTVRPFNQPKPADLASLVPGAAVFNNNCAICHGGAKWTKSQVLYLNNPALDKAFAAGGTPRDPGLTMIANQAVEYTDPKVDTGTLRFLEDIGTFNAGSAIEIRGAGAAIGQGALGVDGFNVPSVLSTAQHAPFFHDGSAQTLEEVFTQHRLNGGFIADVLNDADEVALLGFLRALDGRTALVPGANDIFRDPSSNLP